MHGIDESRKYPGSIIMWTTADTMYEPGFLARLARESERSTSTISYPHIAYPTIGDLDRKTSGFFFWEGLDYQSFTSDIFDDEDCVETVRRYRNDGWGASEFYLMSFGMVWAKRRLNLWPDAISKVENDRTLTDETRAFLTSTNTTNGRIVAHFGAEHGLPKNRRLWFLAYHFHIFSFSPMRPYIWLVSRFRYHVLGVRYRLRKSFGLTK